MSALATAPTPSAVRLSTAGWAAVGFVLLYLVGIGTATGQQVDEAAMRWTAAVITRDGWAETLLGWVSAGSVLLVGVALAIVTALTRGLPTAALGALSGRSCSSAPRCSS